ncbi:short-chain dehydrogenase [Pisolithus orientalis]|uniref:short-chain dehydrogenase n=1 Tax=Pisolithus orientalis TaxID=936130 RepID=UPI0022245CFB|nr:short-chain dehydrogenase [Pisolithus orientalis]KAI5989654.1 short-chain dehydrogenase [Pisolithus orientalis]
MGKFSIAQHFREQWKSLPIYSGDVGSKAIMVVGSNVGIGLEASVHLTRMKPKLLFPTCRDEEKCERTREVLMERTDDDGDGIIPLPLDLSSFDSVRAFAATFAAQPCSDDGLNVLVANAGMFIREYTTTSDNWEITLQVNYLSTALLSILMLPHLVKASTPESPSRLVVVSSLGHYFGAGRLKNAGQWESVLEGINDRNLCYSGDRYNVTKLLEVMFVRELAARLPTPTPVVACTVHPGFCLSNLFRDISGKWYTRLLISLAGVLFSARTAEEGSRTLVHAAVGPDELAMHGRYLSSCRVAEEADYLFTPEGQAFSGRLWTETIDTLSKVDGRVPDIVKQYLRVD